MAKHFRAVVTIKVEHLRAQSLRHADKRIRDIVARQGFVVIGVTLSENDVFSPPLEGCVDWTTFSEWRDTF